MCHPPTPFLQFYGRKAVVPISNPVGHIPPSFCKQLLKRASARKSNIEQDKARRPNGSCAEVCMCGSLLHHVQRSVCGSLTVWWVAVSSLHVWWAPLMCLPISDQAVVPTVYVGFNTFFFPTGAARSAHFVQHAPVCWSNQCEDGRPRLSCRRALLLLHTLREHHVVWTWIMIGVYVTTVARWKSMLCEHESWCVQMKRQNFSCVTMNHDVCETCWGNVWTWIMMCCVKHVEETCCVNVKHVDVSVSVSGCAIVHHPIRAC
jgi:hypothetical protein